MSRVMTEGFWARPIFRNFWRPWGSQGAPRSLDPSQGILGTYLYGFGGIRMHTKACIYMQTHVGSSVFSYRFLLHCIGSGCVYRAMHGGCWCGCCFCYTHTHTYKHMRCQGFFSLYWKWMCILRRIQGHTQKRSATDVGADAMLLLLIKTIYMCWNVGGHSIIGNALSK